MKEDNTVVVVQQALKKYKCRVTDSTTKNFLLAHPRYPTLKSVCDGLKKWGIEYYPLKLETKEIENLEMPFIVHFNQEGGQLAFVEEIAKGKVKYIVEKGKREIVDFEKFAKKISGAVIVMESGPKAGENNYQNNRQNEIIKACILPLVIISILLFATLQFFTQTREGIQSEFVLWSMALTKLLGIIASIFLILHELKVHTPIGDKLCGFSSKTDCDAVLASNASQLYGSINWADVGIIYFTATIIFLVGCNEISSFGLLAILSCISLPYPIFSIYYQSFKLKKWCPFCLLVQLVLVAEFLILLPTIQDFVFSMKDLIRMSVAFVIPVAVWIVYKMYYQKSLEFEQEHYSFLQLKRTPELFLFFLKKGGRKEFTQTKYSLILGDSEAPVTLTVFLSLYCSPCATAYKNLKVLLNNCSEIKINAIFSVYKDKDTQQIINTLYYLNATKGAGATLDFLDKWYSLSKQSKKILYSKEIVPEDCKVAEQLGNTNNQLFKEYQISGTPTIFVNGYKFPTLYEYSDMEYYIEDIKQLSMESKRQAASTTCN